MRRSLLFLLGIILSVSNVNAGKVTEQQALQKARQFMKDKNLSVANLKALTRSDQSISSDAFYIFNAENKGGFVIVSGDDRTVEILGYSDHGELIVDKAPCNVKWLLECYQHVLDSLSQEPNVKAWTRNGSPSRTEIEPLITTHWGQGAPYNDLCPTIDGQKCVTGCVATAMAQIMNYHKWPQDNTSAIDAYTTGSYGISMPQLSPTSFDWNNMRDEYFNVQTTEAENQAVAKLMQYCGQAINMDYGIDASGASEWIDEQLIKRFGYSICTHSFLGTKLSAEHLEEVVYNELASNRPVFYTGTNSSMGKHAFVVDGYKEDGTFHINWGWNGDDDGYFVLTGLTEDVMPFPFQDFTTALTIEIEPLAKNVSNSKVMARTFSYSPRSVYRKNTMNDFTHSVWLTSSLHCDYDNITFDVGYGLYDINGQLIKVLAHQQKNFPLDGVYQENILFGNDIPVGTYEVMPIYRYNTNGEWMLDARSSYNHLIAHINENSLIFEGFEDDSNGDYQEFGVCEVGGITYKLYSEFGNKRANVLPYQLTEKYSGEIVIPNEIEYDGIIYNVFSTELDYRLFEENEELTSLTCGVENGVGLIRDCPNLEMIKYTQGSSSEIQVCNKLENIEFPITMNNPGISYCNKLKTIKIYSKSLDWENRTICWDDTSLPLLEDVYLYSSTPPRVAGYSIDGNYDTSCDIPANSHATLHVPKGSLGAYKSSRWKLWNIVDDVDVSSPYITWGYCHSDVVSSHGMSSGMGDNDAEYAMRIPAEEMNLYKGNLITHIEVFSPNRSINDFKDEDFEYVFITKPGTDYLVKQSFKVLRGTWNTVKLDVPYTITGDSLYVGVGRHSKIGIRFSDDTYVLDASWQRPMGSDYGDSEELFVPGQWVLPCPVDQAHPLPLRFAIEGENVPKGVVIRELSLNESGTTMQGVLRNRSLEPVKSVTVEWFVDGLKTSKTYETHLAPNGCEIITFELTESLLDGGYHQVKADVTAVNGADNPLSGKYLPMFTIGTKPGIFTAKAKEGVTMTFRILDDEAKTCQVGDGEEGSASIDQSTPGTVTIPNEVNGYKVIGIGDYGFYKCAELTTIWLPEGLEFIGKYAFYGCTKLRTIKIPDTVTKVNDGSTIFDGCINIREIEIPYVPNFGEIIAGLPSDVKVTIIQRKTVIGGNAEEETGLEEVVIPKPVTSIGERAFSNLPSVRLMIVEEGNSVFDSRDDCNAIIRTADDILLFGCQSTKIPVSVKGIESYAFEGHAKLASVTLPKGVASIGEAAFSGCTVLMNVVSRIKVPFAINDNTFTAETYANATLTVPYGTKEAYSKTDGWKNFVNVVEDENFDIVFADAEVKRLCVENWDSDADGELSVDEAGAVMDLGEVFQTNKTITTFNELQYFKGLDQIGRLAFSQCVNLTSVVIPNSVKTLCYSAFFQSGLTSIDIPNSVETIEAYVFDNCKSLTSVFIPKSVTSIKYNLFKNCSSIESISVDTDNPKYNSKNNCNAIIRTEDNVLVSGCKNTKILDGITVIGEYAFQGCDGLTTVELPSSVTKLDVYSFSYCPNLSKIVVLSENPAKVNLGAFEDLSSSATLYVPAGSKEKYEQAEGWSDFKNIVEMGETAAITIGKSGKASYCGDQSLDFSFSDEVKAYIATGFDKDEGTIWLTRVKDVPVGVPVLIKGEANKTYDVPVTDSQNSYYTNMFVGNTSGDKIQISETDGNLVNYYLAGDGTFKSVKGYANIGNNKSYLQLPGTFNPTVVGGNQTVKIGSVGKASYAAPVDLDFTNVTGLKAFTATGYDKSSKTIWLTRVMKVQKGEGVLLKGNPQDYEIPSAAVQSSYMNMFVGNTSGDQIQVLEKSDDGSLTNYYLKGDGTFVSVNGYVNINNNKCYLALPTSMVSTAASTRGEANYLLEESEVITMPVLFRSLDNDGDGTTAIRETKQAKEDGAYYTLQGQRVENPNKGVYIRNGKKVVIK